MFLGSQTLRAQLRIFGLAAGAAGALGALPGSLVFNTLKHLVILRTSKLRANSSVLYIFSYRSKGILGFRKAQVFTQQDNVLFCVFAQVHRERVEAGLPDMSGGELLPVPRSLGCAFTRDRALRP